MKRIKVLLFAILFAVPTASFAVNDFQAAAQLLSAAKNADIQQVQALVNNGANVNYVDNTGLSLVCTALMNNDVRAAQILQMYGADASQCDRQIKKYNQKKPKENTGGLFSGLSSAQSIALAAAGAAVVIGGVLWLSDAFGSSNSNSSSSSPGAVCRPNAACTCSNGTAGTCNADGVCANCGTDPSGGATAAFTLPYGPAMKDANAEAAEYTERLNDWNPNSVSGNSPGNPNTNSIYSNDFAAMSQNGHQNHLLIMHGYSALARGYLGQHTFRDSSNKPVTIQNATGGGRPVAVALVTGDGVNPTGSAGRGDIDWATSAAADSATHVADKYMNYNPAGGTEISGYDLSGHGTVFNSSSTETDMAKIIAGWEANGARPSNVGDLYGFIPNGQLAVYRTGAGKSVSTTSGGSIDTDADEITIGTDTYNDLVVNLDGTFTADAGNITGTINGNILQIDSGATYEIFMDGSLHQMSNAAYKNWTAMNLARTTAVDAISNAYVLPGMRDPTTMTVSGIRAFAGTDKAKFGDMINYYYSNGTSDTSQGTDALSLLNAVGAASPVIIISAGEFAYGVGAGQTLDIQEATLESYAPVLFPNIEHMFMTIVAVNHVNGTGSVSSISGYDGTGAVGKLALGYHVDDQGTPSTADDVVYASRACGRTAGRGAAGIDPWCFAAAGNSGAEATAAAAGAFAALKGAFNMTNAQTFALMALTSDGYMLGTDPRTGNAWAGSTAAARQESLIQFLKDRYSLPTEYQDRVTDGENYLDVFAEVFGYGMINLENATKPGSKIYYYNGNDIVSGNGNAYWRKASNTIWRSSGVFSPQVASISAPFFDVLTSADGSLTLPRVWKNEFAAAASDARGLYMGDVLGEFNVRKSEARNQKSEFGNMSLEMSFSEKPYADNLGGLDNMRFGYSVGDTDVRAGYQRHFTDGANRFDATVNPILGLASNAVSADVKHNFGKWSFGARAFSGTVTDESLLENDPTITSQYTPMTLGRISGAEGGATWGGEKIGLTASIGTATESGTILGAQTGGLLGMGPADTTYVDTVAKFRPIADVAVSLRATFARTAADATGDVILGMTDVESNAFSAAVEFGNWSFAVAQPLAVTSGRMQYAHADYEIVEDIDGKFDLNIADAHVADLALAPNNRELRFSGAYRHKFGPWTDGAVGFIYRVNPNNTNAFGDESIFMFKLSHRLGI